MEIDLEKVMKMACRSYHDELNRGNFAEKGLKGKVFLKIIRNLFDLYGNTLGYYDYDFSLFFSDIILLKNEKKKVGCSNKEILPEESVGCDGLYFFTINQVIEYDLQPDTYF